MPTFIAIIDIGKTHSKLSFIDAATGREASSHKHANASIDSAIGRQLDVAGIERWLIERFRSAPETAHVAALVPIAHGATAVLVDANGDVVAAPDYEDPRFEQINDAYARERDPFVETLSPALPLGLNLARQLFYLKHRQAEAYDRARHVLLYPQYWAWRFSGVMASEATSLGCHTDLWRPHAGQFSALARANGWDRLLPDVLPARQALGTVSESIAVQTGLPRSCRVICGIHDSNASYLQYLIDRPREQPFAVISSGTWTVLMANRGDLSNLDDQRDMLANVDAFGSPVATARFMGGREYEAIAGRAGAATEDDLAAIVKRGAFALPAFAPAGPFAGSKGHLLNASDLTDPQRQALASAYCALLSDLLLDLLGASGDVLVDGPFASNPLFLSLLATWRPQSGVLSRSASGACTRAATYLAGYELPGDDKYAVVRACTIPNLDTYRSTWRRHLPS